MMLIFIEILCLVIFSLFVDVILDSLFGFLFFKNTGAVNSFFSVRDFIVSILFIFCFLRQANSSFKLSISDILSVVKIFLFKSSIDLFIIVNSLSARAFRFSISLFTCRFRSFLISFKTISEIFLVSLISVLGRPGRGVGKISPSASSLFPESNFKFSSIRFLYGEYEEHLPQ